MSALVSFTQAWVVTNFDEMLDLLRYFGHDERSQRHAEGAGLRARPPVARVLRRDRPQQHDPGERGAQPYFSRIAQANQRFTDEGVPGWRTDRGEVYVNLGPPDESIENTPGTTANRILRWTYIRPPAGALLPGRERLRAAAAPAGSRAEYERTLARLGGRASDAAR